MLPSNCRKPFVVLAVLTFLVFVVGPSFLDYWHTETSTARAQPEMFGERVYRENCVACHGEKGDGKGPQAYRLRTKPRDFTKGIYKFRSTPSGSLPLDKDVYRTITQGVRGT